VGHESCHEGDLDRQLQETLCNIESLLGHAGETSATRVDYLNNLSSVKIYIRHPRHLSMVKDSLERYFHREIPAMYLQGDICRSDLLLEIEAICHVQGR
jgi:chorismate lyase/3-hydroxybenzoate synthase